MCTSSRVAAVLTVGAHGTTFGGNPVASVAAIAALGELARPELLAHVREVGAYFAERLRALAARHSVISAVRGLGLMLGAELTERGAPVVERCLRDGLLINCCAERVLRFVPPLIITREQVDEGCAILERALAT